MVTTEERQRQLKQAEELLFSGPELPSFVQELYYGRVAQSLLLPYPTPATDGSPEIDDAVEAVGRFVDQHLDAAAIDRAADIPRDVIDGLAALGVLGMTVPREYGGRGMSQYGYCRIMELIGARCASTAVFVNAHHSIGVRALVLFGTEEQKARWLPPLARGEKLGAFALTEPEAGSDAAAVQTRAQPSPDGDTYVLNGEKRYITNGALADVLTVMARTPVPGSDADKVTAFLVTRDLPGFEVTEARMDKCGIRGTVTSRLAFRDMPVPADRILGGIGNGLRVALTVLDFGRTTFGASCTGSAKVCVEAAIAHANTRRQFGRTLGEFELVKKKLAWMAAHCYAMEATTYQTAALIDRGKSAYMLETAMLKVFATEALWRIVNDTMQIFGGQAYFSREPYERMMRDARINMIGEGANDVLLAFIALVGMRPVGEALKRAWEALRHPLGGAGVLARYFQAWATRIVRLPAVPVRHARFEPDARRLAVQIRRFAKSVETLLRYWREAIVERQYVQERIARAAIDLYTSCCVLARLDAGMAEADPPVQPAEDEVSPGRYYLRLAARHFDAQLAHLWDADDRHTTEVADRLLRSHAK